MAENKKSFLLYSDLLHTFNELSDDEAGRLIKHLFMYVNDLNPIPIDRITKIAFEPIKQQLKRDLQKWEGIKVDRSTAGQLGGKKSGETRALKAELKRLKALNEANEANALIMKQNEANEAVNDNVNDTVIVEKIKTPTHDFFTIKQFEEIKWGDEFSLLCERALSKPLVEVKKLFTIFIFKQKGESKLFWKDEPDAKKHFINWLRKQPNPQSISASRRVDN